MSTPTEAQICDAIVNILKAVEGRGPVYPGYVLPKDMGLTGRNNLTWDAGKRMNVCFVERITVSDLRHGNNKGRIVKTTHVYAVFLYFEYFIVRDGSNAIDFAQSSPRRFQQRLEANRAAFNLEANVNLGLGNTITHSGLNVPQQMGLSSQYDNQPHMAAGQIEVTQGYC